MHRQPGSDCVDHPRASISSLYECHIANSAYQQLVTTGHHAAEYESTSIIAVRPPIVCSGLAKVNTSVSCRARQYESPKPMSCRAESSLLRFCGCLPTRR
jgi:hypothetical protein